MARENHARAELGGVARTFGSVPALFCGKLLNRAWPKPKIIRTEDASEVDASSAAHGSVGIMEPLIGRRDVVLELPRDATGESEDPSDATGADPAGFLTEATDIRWQHFARAWNAIVKDLRARDHLSDSERDDLSFVFLRGEDVEDIFESPEYVVMPAMMTSPVFSTSSLETGGGSEYASFARTLTQAKGLLCVLLTEVMGVVRPREIHALMRTIAALANIEGEQMAQRRMDDVEVRQLRDAVAALTSAASVARGGYRRDTRRKRRRRRRPYLRRYGRRYGRRGRLLRARPHRSEAGGDGV